ncbi:MAG TPA: hypothetical protein PKE26_16555, partial [Kiritimatiellia bacterium]|nr:hypothetical protein [Kiritimatiellia bacterium]HMP00708.1 hypothetical protein [Kiritimatiellia bacterium]
IVLEEYLQRIDSSVAQVHAFEHTLHAGLPAVGAAKAGKPPCPAEGLAKADHPATHQHPPVSIPFPTEEKIL